MTTKYDFNHCTAVILYKEFKNLSPVAVLLEEKYKKC